MPDNGTTNWPSTDNLNLPADMDTRAPTSAGDGNYTFKQWLERVTGVLRAIVSDSRWTDSRTPSGTAGGDLTGTYPNPTGAATLEKTANKGTASGYAALDAGSRVVQRPKLHELHGLDHSDAFRPTAAIAETFPRFPGPLSDLSILTSARLTMFGIYLESGQVVSSISFFSGATPLNAGLNQHFSLWNASRQFLAATSDDTSTAWAANAKKTLSIATVAATPAGTRGAGTSYTITASGLYLVGICVKATTAVPSLRASTALGTIANLAPQINNTDVGPFTDPASLPNTAANSGNPDAYAYAYVS